MAARSNVIALPKANPSGINPTEYKVLVKPKAVEEKTAGGIFIPDESREREQYASTEGELVAISPLAFTYEDRWPEGFEKPKVGDRVIFAKYAGTKLKGKDGGEYRIVNDRDIAAVLA